jgi:type VI secretion system secreted protein VgrG
MHARYFSPNLGRFLSVDPVGGEVSSSQSWNRYTYVRNNPVNLSDPTGKYVGIDDAVFAGVGLVVGLVAQGITDLVSGQVSDWEDYAAAGAGGAVGGEALLYTGPIGAGAAGGLATNLTRQGLKNLTGKQEGFDAVSTAVDTGLGAATGLLKIPKVPGVTAGKNNMNAVFKQMVTKAQNGTISNMETSTALKMVVGRTTDTALVPGAGAAAAAVGVTERLRNQSTGAAPALVPSHQLTPDDEDPMVASH